jgi:hypothetical protein
VIGELRALEKLPAAGGQPVYAWIDAFCVCQHGGWSQQQMCGELEWSMSLSKAIGGMQHTLLVMHEPWQLQAPGGALRRLWCLWECAAALLHAVPLQIVVPAPATQQWQKVLTERLGEMVTTLRELDVTAAAASTAADGAMLDTTVRKTLGYERLQETIGGWLREWLLAEARRVFCESASDNSELSAALASFLSDLGRYQEAGVLLEQQLARHKAALGASHPTTLEAVEAFCANVAWQHQQPPAKRLSAEAAAVGEAALLRAEKMLRGALERRRGGEGKSAAPTMATTHQLARFFLSKFRYTVRNSSAAAAESHAALLARAREFTAARNVERIPLPL